VNEALVFLLVMSAGFLNRFRGGGYGAHLLPGHPRFYVVPLVGLMVYAFYGHDGEGGLFPYWLTLPLIYLWWSWWPWGEWFDLGRMPRRWQGRKETWFEWAIDRISFGWDHAALYHRHVWGLLPLVLLVPPPVVPLLAVLVVASYEIGWRLAPRENRPIVIG